MTAPALAAHATLAFRLVDVRPLEERFGPEGYLPGSVCASGAQLEQLLEQPLPVVLYCLSGHRSQKQADALMVRGFRVASLAGGVLGWRALGLPVCGHGAQALPGDPDFVRALESCFVAESAQQATERGRTVTFNPRGWIRELLTSSPTFDWLLDQVAERARLNGHELARIAQNVDALRAMLRAPDGLR
jgi:rhodanese-related sulfurtransferase